jgi:hypothetical protein
VQGERRTAEVEQSTVYFFKKKILIRSKNLRKLMHRVRVFSNEIVYEAEADSTRACDV